MKKKLSLTEQMALNFDPKAMSICGTSDGSVHVPEDAEDVLSGQWSDRTVYIIYGNDDPADLPQGILDAIARHKAILGEVNSMGYKCVVCKDEHVLDDVRHYNINGEEVDNSPEALERNAQNPDYAPHVICWYCDELRQNDDLDLVNDDGTLSEDVQEMLTYVE